MRLEIDKSKARIFSFANIVSVSKLGSLFPTQSAGLVLRYGSVQMPQLVKVAETRMSQPLLPPHASGHVTNDFRRG
jgi:hypothetical protein